jgi:hypothetical protein
MCMRAEKCLKTVSKLSIMVKQHIFNINSQSLLVEIIFIKRGNLLPRLLLIYVHKNFLLLLCSCARAVLRLDRCAQVENDDGLGQRCANKRAVKPIVTKSVLFSLRLRAPAICVCV